jgi:curved DNA-binding protein CbpA
MELRRVVDPYRELGVQRAASDAQIKAAHRRLAKRFHPDAAGGDTRRFLAVQEAYLLLSDPLRRKEWDTSHAPGPVRAGSPAAHGRGRPTTTDRTHEGQTTGAQRVRRPGTSQRPAPPPSAGDGGEEARADAPLNVSDRPAGSRRHHWSAENVPWWEDFSPRPAGPTDTPDTPQSGRNRHAAGGRAPRAGAAGRERTGASGPASPTSAPAGSAASNTGRAAGAAATGTAGARPGSARQAETDVYNRSSGAAWSSAARRYFRKADADLPSRGTFVYRGTQVVTGARAREAAEELLRRRPGVGAAPRQAFEHHPPDGARGTGRAGPGSAPRAASSAGAASGAAAAPGARADRRDQQGAPDAEPAPPAADVARTWSAVPAALAGGTAAAVVTMALLVVAGLVLSPPLQPAFALVLLVLAAATGAVGSVAIARLSRPMR